MTRSVAVLLAVAAWTLSYGCKSGPEAAASPSPSSESTSADVARFRFGWSPGTVLQGDVRRSLRRTSEHARTYRTTYRLRVAGRGRGLRVEVVPKVDAQKTVGNAHTYALATASAVALPTIEVTQEGAFDGVTDVKKTETEFLESVRNLNGGSLGRRQRRALQPLLEKGAMTSRARQFWNLHVGVWAGTRAEIGESLNMTSTDTFQFPVLGRRELEIELEGTVQERVPCTDRPAESRSNPQCVRIAMTSRPDVREMKDSMQQWVDRFAAEKARAQGMSQPPDLKVGHVFVETDITLVTNPSTLVPVRSTQKKTVRMSLESSGGQKKSYKLVDELRTDFTVQEGG